MYRYRITAVLRQQVWIKSYGRVYDALCSACEQNHINAQHFSVDHIKPVSKGGLNKLDNLRAICFKCNSSKSNTLLKRPRE